MEFAAKHNIATVVSAIVRKDEDAARIIGPRESMYY